METLTATIEKITIVQDFASFTYGLNWDEIAEIDEPKTMDSFESELRHELGLRFPGVEVDFSWGQGRPAVSVSCDDYALEQQAIADIDAEISAVFQSGNYWVNKA